MLTVDLSELCLPHGRLNETVDDGHGRRVFGKCCEFSRSLFILPEDHHAKLAIAGSLATSSPCR